MGSLAEFRLLVRNRLKLPGKLRVCASPPLMTGRGWKGEDRLRTLISGIKVRLRKDVVEQFTRLTFENGAHPGEC